MSKTQTHMHGRENAAGFNDYPAPLKDAYSSSVSHWLCIKQLTSLKMCNQNLSMARDGWVSAAAWTACLQADAGILAEKSVLCLLYWCPVALKTTLSIRSHSCRCSRHSLSICSASLCAVAPLHHLQKTWESLSVGQSIDTHSPQHSKDSTAQGCYTKPSRDRPRIVALSVREGKGGGLEGRRGERYLCFCTGRG